MEFKYVMIHLHEPIERLVPILFPSRLAHSSVFDSMLHCEEAGFKTATVRSAGYYNTESEEAYGHSSSLGVTSHKDDGDIITNYEYNHGIVFR